MLRLNFPGGQISAAQLRQVAKQAADQGCDFADLTTCQGLQLYGIPPEDSSEASSRSAEAPGEASFCRSRSAEGCPLAGAVSAEVFDAGVRQQEQPDLFTIGVPILVGRIETDQMRKVADLAERYADGTLRLTPRQNLLFLNVPKDRVAQILEGLETVGLSARASVVARALVLCPGGESAEPGKPDLTRLAQELVEYLERRVPMDQPFTIHMSGLDGGCERHEVAEIGLQGKEIFDVWVGGRLAAQQIPAGQIRFRIEQLLMGYKRGREPGESLKSFFARAGGETVRQLLADPTADAAAQG